MLEENISAVTSLPENLVKNLSKYMPYIHSHSIATQLLSNNDNVFELEIFEGTIMIKLENDTIEYKFIPNESFAQVVRETILSNKSLLVDGISNKIKKLLEKAYKDVL